MPWPLALLACLALVGLPPATGYSHLGWAPVLALATVAGVGAYAWLARGQEPVPVRPGETAFLFLAGGGLTTLFWVRAQLGVPGVILGDLPLEITWRFGGWGWPALLLVVLYRRRGEGLRPGGGRRAGTCWGSGSWGAPWGSWPTSRWRKGCGSRRTWPATSSGPWNPRRPLPFPAGPGPSPWTPRR
jgi:hypothetical protein